jgi:hypothetical protein
MRNEMITEYIKPKKNTFQIHIPEDYLNCSLEINIRKIDTFDEKAINKDINCIVQQTAGIISKGNVNPIEWQKMIREEWERKL